MKFLIESVIIHINFNSLIHLLNCLYIHTYKSHLAKSIIFSILSYQIFSNINVVCIRFIITSIERQCQFNSNDICISFTKQKKRKRKNDRSYIFIVCPRSDQPVCIYPSFRALNSVKDIYIYIYQHNYSRRRRRRKKELSSRCSFLLHHLSRFLLVQLYSY